MNFYTLLDTTFFFKDIKFIIELINELQYSAPQCWNNFKFIWESVYSENFNVLESSLTSHKSFSGVEFLSRIR